MWTSVTWPMDSHIVLTCPVTTGESPSRYRTNTRAHLSSYFSLLLRVRISFQLTVQRRDFWVPYKLRTLTYSQLRVQNYTSAGRVCSMVCSQRGVQCPVLFQLWWNCLSFATVNLLPVDSLSIATENASICACVCVRVSAYCCVFATPQILSCMLIIKCMCLCGIFCACACVCAYQLLLSMLPLCVFYVLVCFVRLNSLALIDAAKP